KKLRIFPQKNLSKKSPKTELLEMRLVSELSPAQISNTKQFIFFMFLINIKKIIQIPPKQNPYKT
ncbi:hypothetical protein, partial [Citrobacter freundii]